MTTGEDRRPSAGESTSGHRTPGDASGVRAEPADPSGELPPAGEERWQGVERGLLVLRRRVLCVTLAPLVLVGAVLPPVLGSWVGALAALLPLALGCWGWWVLGRNWVSWRYAERVDDLLISRGILFRRLTVVPYGRMQLVEVTSGPLERRHGVAGLQLHTAAAATDAKIPGLAPQEAERLRDRLTRLGEARSAGL
ncbi:PH domain-containing protein [Streptomyces sp. NPDC005438]|uniref:PH domain-containing protein n=1 Tax=Streptomyces sp. NPDC005438 TaxID=3156880 RepID=UPI0033B5F250